MSERNESESAAVARAVRCWEYARAWLSAAVAGDEPEKK